MESTDPVKKEEGKATEEVPKTEESKAAGANTAPSEEIVPKKHETL